MRGLVTLKTYDGDWRAEVEVQAVPPMPHKVKSGEEAWAVVSWTNSGGLSNDT